jgi:hypothetical protein
MKSRHSRRALPLLAAPAALVLSAVAFAQTTATVSGVVTDPSGAVVPNAQVKVLGLATGTTRDAVSDSAGIYIVPSLLPGDYKITIQAPGFGLYTIPVVKLDVDQKITLNAQLAVNSEGQTVEVNSAAAALVADTITVGSVIDQRTVQELPLNGRHFLDLTVLTPGGVTAPSAGSLTAPSRGLGANSFNTAGNREDSVNFQINGVNLNDNSQNQITFQPSINTTSEFKIDNSTYSAEYGRSSGSIVNVSTRSGTNKFHGEAFDYNRNNSFDARNFFNPKGTAQNALKRNNFGGALGGPILHDKLFFFASYEGLRQHQGLLLNSGTFTDAQRAAITAANNPSSVALLALIPRANSTATGSSVPNRFVGNANGPVNIDQYTGDVFAQFNEKNQVHGFYAFQKDVRTEPTLQYGTAPLPGFGDHRAAHRQVATASFYHIFSPTLSNEARIGANRISIAFIPNFTPNPTAYGIGDGINAAVGIPQITVVDAGFSFGGPSGFPQGRTDNLGLFNDTLTYLRGKHTLRIGGEYRRSVNNSFGDDTGTLTYNTTANFIAGVANTFSITPTAVNSRIFTNAAAGFLEDTYKLLPNFTLELGIRFEWNGTPTEGANRFINFNNLNAQLVPVQKPYNQNYNYEPRVGFTWDPYKAGKTIVRGAYGIMADQPTSNAVSGLAGNPPFATGVSYSSSSVPLPVATIFTAAGASSLAISAIQPNFSNAYTETYNFNIQQQMPASVILNVGYYGSEGKHLRVRLNDNQPTNGTNASRPYQAISLASPYKPGASLSAANIADVASVSRSMYNGLWVTATKNFQHGLQFLFTYNWTKSMDLNSLGSQGGYAFQDSNNPQTSYGLSDFDARHRIAANAVYDLPTLSHFHNLDNQRFFGGFRLSGIEQWQTGNPVNIVNTSTYTGVSGVIHPSQLAPVVKRKIEGTSAVTFFQAPVCNAVATPGCVFLNTGTLSGAGAFTASGFGNVRRNSVTGPGFSNLDVSLEKNTKITERVNLQLRVDAFDVANHPSFANPSGTDTSGTFGQSTSTRFPVADSGSSRQLQLVGKVTF